MAKAKKIPAPKNRDAASTPPKNPNPKGHSLTSKSAKVTRHKAPERRNENKVRGR